MAYQVNPNAADQLSVSQGDIKENFQQLLTWAQVNHVGIDAATPATNGMHKYLTLTQQGAPGAPLTTAPNINLWNNAGQLMLQTSTIAAFPLTDRSVTQDQGYYYTAGGLLIKYLRTTLGLGTHLNLNMNAGGTPNFAQIFAVWVQADNNVGNTDVNRAYTISGAGTAVPQFNLTISLRDSSIADPGVNSQYIFAIGR